MAPVPRRPRRRRDPGARRRAGARRPRAEGARPGRRPHRRAPIRTCRRPSTRRRRGRSLGDDAIVAPEQGLVLETDPDRARAIAREFLARYIEAPNYTNNWRRLGFTEDDLAGGGSDRLVDALLAWGDEDALAARVQAHRDAGASHVCVQVLTDRAPGLPARRVAPPRPGALTRVTYEFDRFLRYDELTALAARARRRPPRPRRASSPTDAATRVATCGWSPSPTRATGAHDTKPAHWVDASIHAVELTGDGRRLLPAAPPRRRARRRRPDGPRGARHAHVLRRAAGQPRRRRVGARRPAPVPPVEHAAVAVARRPPLAGAHVEDVDGDGRILQMRIADPDGAWMPHPEDARLLVPVPPTGPPPGTTRYRLLDEATVVDHDGFTVPDAPPARGPRPQPQLPGRAGRRVVRGAGDHPLSEPEIDALVRAIVRPAATSAATTPSTPPAACCCGRRRPSPTRRCRRGTCGRGSSSASGAPRSPGTRCTRCTRTSRGTRPTR